MSIMYVGLISYNWQIPHSTRKYVRLCARRDDMANWVGNLPKHLLLAHFGKSKLFQNFAALHRTNGYVLLCKTPLVRSTQGNYEK